MKKMNMLFVFLIAMISLFSCKTEDSYKMPYEPGCYVADKDSFYANKLLWEENIIDSYSYTYTYEIYEGSKALLGKDILDVFVEKGTVSYVLKERDGYTEADVSEDSWNQLKETMDNLYKSGEELLIENIYKKINGLIEEGFKTYEENPKCFYKKIDFEFSETEPYLLSYDSYTNWMIKDLNGNAGRVVIKIENFKAE